MTSKLYIANLARDASEDALRAHFAACGGVSDVEILQDRRTGEPRGLAHVTMTSPAFAHAAVDQLNGAAFRGQPLRVSHAPVKNDGKEGKELVKIAQQFRERNNMTYDLDCAGAALTLRMFPTMDGAADGSPWTITARTTDAADAVVVTATGKTRREALGEVGRWWLEQSGSQNLPTLDWDAIARALTGVHAI